jgi:hypothetical protein
MKMDMTMTSSELRRVYGDPGVVEAMRTSHGADMRLGKAMIRLARLACSTLSPEWREARASYLRALEEAITAGQLYREAEEGALAKAREA